MDSMNIEKGGALSILVNPFIESVLKKKTGVKADIDLAIKATTEKNGKTHVHIDLDGDLSEEGWEQLLRFVGVPKIVTKIL
jgi:uncharacterized OsmC-like protein